MPAKSKPRPRLHNGDAPTYEFRLTAEELDSAVGLFERVLANDWEATQNWMRHHSDTDRRCIMNACVSMRNRLVGRQ